MKTPVFTKGVAATALALGLTLSFLGAPAVAQTIKIGAPLALTGGLADEGKKQATLAEGGHRRPRTRAGRGGSNQAGQGDDAILRDEP
jgi:hypothetical protein